MQAQLTITVRPSTVDHRDVGRRPRARAVLTAAVVVDSEIAAHDGDVLLDLAAVDSVGFAGADLLIEWSRRFTAQHRRLGIVATNPTLERALDLAGIQLIRANGGETVLWRFPTQRTSRLPSVSVPQSGTPRTAASAAFLTEHLT